MEDTTQPKNVADCASQVREALAEIGFETTIEQSPKPDGGTVFTLKSAGVSQQEADAPQG
jgi:hypothetical protein